jgi:DNA-binding response OmpR family regulator
VSRDTEQAPSKSGARARLMRVVVVDAVLAKAESVALLLMSAGYHCLATDDPEVALEAVREREPSLAVVDLDLPDRQGYALAAKIRAQCPKVRMIATATHEDELERALVPGCVFDAVTLKPIRVDELFEELESARARPGAGR